MADEPKKENEVQTTSVTTSTPLDPTSMTMGWLVGRAVASQRK